MSATESTMPAGGTASGGLPPERRTLVALLTLLEALLLVAASLLAYFFPSPPIAVPVTAGGATGYPCIQPEGPITTGPYPCPPTATTPQWAVLAAVLCGAVGLLVLPAVIGFVSRRWQSALAAPSVPIWLAMLVMVGIALTADFGGLGGSSAGLYLRDVYAWTSVVSTVVGPLLSALLLVVGLGGLGWLARRTVAR